MISLYQHFDGNIQISITSGKRSFRYVLTPERAMELSNRLQSFVKSQQSPATWSLPHE